MQILLNQGLFPWMSYKQDVVFAHILKLFLVLECDY